MKLLDQEVLTLLLGVDAADVDNQVTKGGAAQRTIDPAPLFHVCATFIAHSCPPFETLFQVV